MIPSILVLAAMVRIAPGAGAGAEEPALRFNFRPGQRVVYAQSYRSDSRSDSRALFQEGTDASANASLVMDLQMELQGRLVMDVAHRDATGFLLLVHWEGLRGRVEANRQDQSAFLDSIRRGLAKPVLVRLDDRGRITGVWLDPELEAGVQGTARMLLAQTQCVLPPGGESSWVVKEPEAAGTFEARYERDPGRPGDRLARIRKHLGRYLPATAKPLSGSLQVERDVAVEGTRNIVFDSAAGCTERLEAREVHHTTIAQKRVATSEAVFSLRRLRTTRLGAKAAAKAKEASAAMQNLYPRSELFVEISPRAQEDAVERKELGADRAEEILGALKAAETQADFDAGPLYLKLKALAHVRPDTCMAMGEILATSNPEGLSMRLLASVLGVTGSLQAQEALALAIRRRREEWPALAVLLPALGQCAQPTTASIQLLEELAYTSLNVPVASTAQLMLGTMAFNLARQGTPGQADRIVATALSRLEHADSTPLASRFLLCLGNAGSRKALPTLKTWTATPEPELRALAVYALRWVEDPEVDRILLQALESDPAQEVRFKAIEALKFREGSDMVLSALKRTVASDASPRVRQAALGSLWDLRSTHPDVLPAVEAARQDPDEDVRALAGSMLGKQ